MYLPDFCVRLEIQATDVPSIWDWHIVKGGTQRGGLATHHGYLIVPAVWLDEDLDELMVAFREEVLRHLLRVTHFQATLEGPSQ